MLRGSYAGGSLAVTARRPYRRSGPSATLHARVQAPVPRGTLPDLVSTAAIRRATPPPFTALLLLRASALLIAVAWQSAAEPSHFVAAPCFSIAMRRIGLLRLSVAYAAVLCLSLALSRGATPSRDIAFQSRRPANLGGALPSPCHASLCLGHAVLRFAFASPHASKPSLRCPYRSIAVACRGFASPSPRVASLRSAVTVPGSSWPSYPMPLRCSSLPVLRGAVRFLAAPLPIASQRCSSFADLGSAVHFRRRAGQSKSLPSQLSA